MPAPAADAGPPAKVVHGAARLRPGVVAPPWTSLRVMVLDSNKDRVGEQVIPNVARWPVEFDVPIEDWPEGKAYPISLGVHVRGLSENAPMLMSEPEFYRYEDLSKGRRVQVELFPSVE